MKVLIVTCHLPTDDKTDKHGWFKRIELFIDALKDIAEIHILYYINDGQENLKLETTTQIETNLSNKFNKLNQTVLRYELNSFSNLATSIVAPNIDTTIFDSPTWFRGTDLGNQSPLPQI